MTGPAAGEPDRGKGEPQRSTAVRDTASGILWILALGLALRVIIAYLLPGSGFSVDLGAFRYWANDLADNGLRGFARTQRIEASRWPTLCAWEIFNVKRDES